MDFFIGDKILFKKDSLKGKIIKINSLYKVTVLTEDGFEIYVSKSDLVRVEHGTSWSCTWCYCCCHIIIFVLAT